MCYGRGSLEKIKIRCAELDHKTSCKYFGVILDKTLNFHEHIQYVEKKINRFGGPIYRIYHFYLRKSLLMFYKSSAKSIMFYGLLVYGSAAKTNMQKIESIQSRFIREFFFWTRLKTLVVADHRIPNVFELFIKEIIQETFKENRNDSPLELIDINLSTHKSLLTRQKVRGLFDKPHS